MQASSKLREKVQTGLDFLSTSPAAFRAEISGAVLACAGVRIIGDDHPLTGLVVAAAGMGLGLAAFKNNDAVSLELLSSAHAEDRAGQQG